MLCDAGIEGTSSCLSKKLSEAADAFKGAVRRLAAFILHLHDHIGIDKQLFPHLFRQAAAFHQSRNKGTVEDAVVIIFFRMVIVQHLQRTQQLCFLQERIQLFFTLRQKSDADILQGGIPVLGADIGNVQIGFLDQLQKIRDSARSVLERAFDQHNVSRIRRGIKISKLFKHFIGLFQLFGLAADIQKYRMRVNCLVVADTGDIDIKVCEDLACFQKRADLVRHCRNICFSHIQSPESCCLKSL